MKLRSRALLLGAAVAAGLVAGLVGRCAWRTDLGFLAIPLLLAIGWLFAADPSRCAPRSE